VKKRRELTEAEKLAVDRLKKIWAVKKAELKLTQEAVGLACGWSGQVAFAQYINGNAPLNVEAVLRIAKVFNVHPTDIMPEINDILPTCEVENKKIAGTAQRNDLSAEALEFARLFAELSSDQRAVLSGAAKAFIDTPKKQEGKRRVNTGHKPEQRKKAV
jgi:transcriptional regulator with XRE-family HTH domain